MGKLFVLATLVLLNTVACVAVDNSVCLALSRGVLNVCQVNTLAGRCIGNIDNGELCECPESRAGTLCQFQVTGPKKNLSLCERQQDLHTTTFRLLNTTDMTDSSIVRFRALVDINVLKSVMHGINVSYLHERSCLPDGTFSSSQCDVSIDDLVTRRCYCVNSTTGDVVHEVAATVLANVNCEAYLIAIIKQEVPVVMGQIRGITVSVFLLTAGYLLVHSQTSDPCASSPCVNSDACVGHGTTNYTCTCRDGHYGKNCEKWVCTTLYRLLNNFNLCGVFTSAAVCIGKIANGELCQCPDTHWGPLCNLPSLGENKSLTLCQRQKQLFITTVRLINETDSRDSSISLLRSITDISHLKSVLHEMNLSYLPVRTCTSDGSFAASQCDVSIDDLSTWKCYCADTETGEALCKVTLGSRTPSNRSCECDCE